MDYYNCNWTTIGDVECRNIEKEPNISFKSIIVNQPLQEMSMKEQVYTSIEHYNNFTEQKFQK